ncbi:MAG: response regulator [Deltaproteobacteria bacterium]|nr:response regulator [Deltaproteobacteria bacterium]
MLRRLIREDIELITDLDPGLWKIKMDPVQVNQVIMNLAINARDAMPEGGILTIETANMELATGYFEEHGVLSGPGPYVVLTVTDTGMGMDREIQSRIFDPFFTTKKRGTGTGHGLSMVYGIVKQNNGHIRVHSEPGEGTTFKVYFLKAEGESKRREGKWSQGEPGGSETVLIVEDDEALRALGRKVLEMQGYRVLEAENVEKALGISKTHDGPIHLVLTDLVMPGMSGKQAAEQIQAIHPDTKVLYMSGYTDNIIVKKGILAEDIHFIEKPFSLDELARKVREVLGGHFD